MEGRRKMKNIMKYFNLAVLLVAMATMTGCMKEDLEENSLVGDVTLTASVKLDTGNGSKQLSETGVKTFAEGEQVAVVYTNSSDQIVKATSVALTTSNISDGGKSATFTVTLTNAQVGTVRYVYPASMVDNDGNETAISTQNGTLTSLSSLYDYAWGEGSFDGSELPNVTLTNQFAIGKITMKNYAGNSDLSDVTGVTITDGTNTYTITPTSPLVSWPIYVAMKPVSSDKTLTLTATGSATNYAKVVTGKTLSAGTMYTLTVKMGGLIDLSAVTAHVTAQDGDVITGTLNTASYPVKISIANNATVTLDGITINGVNNSSYKWAGLNCQGNATIILKDGTTNAVSGFYESYPGIHVPNGNTLTIQGTGTLNASGSYGAGIGGGYRVNCGNIEIQSGTIIASCSENAAAIGGGRDASCGNITISGGHITAASGWGAGIGSGYAYSETTSCRNISITGGTIIATGGSHCAGIGSGCNSNCGAITITSGVTSVTATKGSDAFNSIGKGWGSGSVTCGTVTIDGIVFWQSGAYQNGGGDYLTRTTLVYPQVTDLSTITEDYTASFRETLTGTLGANVKISIADGHTVTLDGVSINASGTWTTGDYAGITCLGDATIVLKDGSANTVKGFYKDYPGISVPAGKTLVIKGETAPGTGSLSASSNASSSDVFSGAGIGGHLTTACGNIEIQGGIITATCTGKYGAGIGGGGGNGAADCGTITISGGTVTANGGGFAAGIGSGTDGDCGAITITSGVTRVTANRGSGSSNDCVGRGNGAGCTCASVTIGGTVYWNGSAYQNDGESHIKQSSLTYQP